MLTVVTLVQVICIYIHDEDEPEDHLASFQSKTSNGDRAIGSSVSKPHMHIEIDKIEVCAVVYTMYILYLAR
jgi:hypothetical protein